MNIQVTVKANSKQKKLVEVDEENFVAYLHSPAVEGKANKELILMLAAKFDVPKSFISIVRGEKTNKKFVEIQLEEDSER